MTSLKNLTENHTNKDVPRAGQQYATIGIILTFIALSLSVMTPWVMEKYAPPPPPEVKQESILNARNMFHSFLSLFWAQPEAVEQENITPPQIEKESSKHWTQSWPLVITLIALGGIMNALAALLRNERKSVIFTAIFFGLSAVVIQYTLIAIIVIVILMLVIGMLSAMGVSF